MHSAIEVLKKFFADSRPLSIQELRTLTSNERAELAELAAEQLGLARVEQEGRIGYHAAA